MVINIAEKKCEITSEIERLNGANMSQGAFSALQIKSKAVSEISSRSIIQQLGSQLFWLKGKIRSNYLLTLCFPHWPESCPPLQLWYSILSSFVLLEYQVGAGLNG